MITPIGGEKLGLGDTFQILFTFNANKAAPPHTALNFDLYRDNTFVANFAKGINGGTGQEAALDWIVGEDDFKRSLNLTPGSNYKIKVYGVNILNVENWNDTLLVVPGIATESAEFSIIQ